MRVWLVILILLVAALACRIEVSTSYIKDVHVTHDPEGAEPIGRGYAYAPGDTFHASVELAEAKGSTTIRAVWSVNEVPGIEPGTVIGEETIEAGNGVIIFHLAPDGEWALGKYQITIYLNGDKEKTVEFRVR